MTEPPDPADTLAFRATVHLARVLMEAGAMSMSDLARAADRLEAEGEGKPEAEREDIEMAAHRLRCAVLPAESEQSRPQPVLRAIEGGKEPA